MPPTPRQYQLAAQALQVALSRHCSVERVAGPYSSRAHLVLTLGAAMPRCRHQLPLATVGQCYYNARQYTLLYPTAYYVEGYACQADGYLIPHAWNIDPQLDPRAAIDVTWPYEDHRPVAYQGLVFQTGYATDTWAQLDQHYSLLEDPDYGWELLAEADPAGYLHPDYNPLHNIGATTDHAVS